MSLRLSNIGNHILHIVCKNGWNDMLLKIIDILSAKSNLSLNITNSKQESLLHFAAYSNSLDVVETILHSKYFRKSKYDQDNNTNNLNAAHYACKRKNNNSDILKLLYTNGINFDQLTKNGKNILHYACKSCNKDQIEYILSIRENMVFTKDGNVFIIIYGKTPLEYDKDGNILMDDKMKSKPFLHDAVKKRNLSFAQYLIKNGFSGNNRDINGNTPIMELCKSCLGCGYTNILNFLLPISDLSLKNNDKSIIEMCADAKNYSALEPILQYEQNNDILDVNQINNIIQSYSDNPQLITILTKFLP
ncbi:hypothetical protein TRFO_39333 [Tritrichomonas foetus]|uniref:Uncharacterized protein n=1 Tax=Tritrichomonas foetus TaxID=1144522 RepID=A0A1J4JAQ9_9EUKA|nr:hypothetical protein TRFO_39333 [Tritrichomonas foetus]|eukprot:OHS94517.1 hypothetical protein TRFO_39333 [Tritrichomonas foetus]